MKKYLFYIFLIIITLILTFSVNNPDYDFWHRLAVGSLFFQTGTIFKHDIFSYLPTKDLWIDHEWGSGVVFYFLVNHFGDLGIFILKAAIIFAIFILIIKIIKLQTNENPVGVFYFLLLGFSLLPGIANLLRCQFFTYLFFTLWLYALERMKRGENKIIWIFPATMLFWVNLHGGFLAGIGLIIIYVVGEFLNRKNYLKYFGTLALTIPVTLINPYGFKLWNFIIEASFMHRPDIQEWHAINLSGPFHTIGAVKIHLLTGFMIFAILTVMTGIKLLRQKEKFDWTRIILVTLLLYFGIRHQRHTEFLVLTVPGLFYHHYIHLLDPIHIFIKNNLTDTKYKIWTAVKYGFGYILLLVILISSLPQLSASITVNPGVYPVGSLAFVKLNNISGNLATTYNWGSYALWKLYPQCKVLIDGRYEQVYSNAVYNMAIQFSEKKGDWQAILRNYRADVLVLSKANYSQEDILRFKDWSLVYDDTVSAVLLPRNKIKSFYIYPDYTNPVYLREDYAKKIY